MALVYPSDTIKRDTLELAKMIKAELITSWQAIPKNAFDIKLRGVVKDARWHLSTFDAERINEEGVEEIALFMRMFQLHASGQIDEAKSIVAANPIMTDTYESETEDYVIQGDVAFEVLYEYSIPKGPSIYDGLAVS